MSTEEGKPLTSETSAPSPVRSRRAKLLFGTVAVLCVAAALAVAAAVLLASHQGGGAQKPDDWETAGNVRDVMSDSDLSRRSSDNEPDSQQLDESEEGEDNARTPSPRATRGAGGGERVQASCFSDVGPEAVAAHISGAKHVRWPHVPDPLSSAFTTSWDCAPYGMPYAPDSAPDAYVHGGMCFLQSDKSLYVPKCGYYHIYSQILFKVHAHASGTGKEVFHQLHFERNCSTDVHETTLMSYASVGPNSESTMTVTTHTSDVVKLCQGGRLWINIPAGPGRSACCPQGGIQAAGSSFFGAVLVSEDNCHWPPKETMEID